MSNASERPAATGRIYSRKIEVCRLCIDGAYHDEGCKKETYVPLSALDAARREATERAARIVLEHRIYDVEPNLPDDLEAAKAMRAILNHDLMAPLAKKIREGGA